MGADSVGRDVLRGEMVALTKRLIAHVENGTTDHANDVFREPVANYTDTAKWQREREILFRNSPLLLGLSADLPEPGSYRALTICDVPILLIRGEDGGVSSTFAVTVARRSSITSEASSVATPASTTRGPTTRPAVSWACPRLMHSMGSNVPSTACDSFRSKSATECCGEFSPRAFP
jgi:hypothetical protein